MACLAVAKRPIWWLKLNSILRASRHGVVAQQSGVLGSRRKSTTVGNEEFKRSCYKIAEIHIREYTIMHHASPHRAPHSRDDLVHRILNAI
jgi:hypothetical protein